MKERIKWHLRMIVKAVDQLLNALLLGWADETLSARCWRLRRYWYARFIMHCINALFFNRNHCKEAFERDKDLPEDYFERHLSKDGQP